MQQTVVSHYWVSFRRHLAINVCKGGQRHGGRHGGFLIHNYSFCFCPGDIIQCLFFLAKASTSKEHPPASQSEPNHSPAAQREAWPKQTALCKRTDGDQNPTSTAPEAPTRATPVRMGPKEKHKRAKPVQQDADQPPGYRPTMRRQHKSEQQAPRGNNEPAQRQQTRPTKRNTDRKAARPRTSHSTTPARAEQQNWVGGKEATRSERPTRERGTPEGFP